MSEGEVLNDLMRLGFTLHEARDVLAGWYIIQGICNGVVTQDK